MQDLVFTKEGPRRLHFRLLLHYALTDVELDPVDTGFVVQPTHLSP